MVVDNFLTNVGLFLTEMGAPGSTDGFGNSNFRNFSAVAFQVPCSQPPPEDGSTPITAGSRTDMGALVLFLVSNWFVNGETVLIDGGVREELPVLLFLSLTYTGSYF